MSQITGDKKQGDEGAAFFGVRVNFHCYMAFVNSLS